MTTVAASVPVVRWAAQRVRFMTPYQMLRIEQARFVLGAHA